MGQRAPLSLAEREQIYQGKLVGKTLAEIAAEVKCSPWCVRKWWRRIRQAGPAKGLAPRKRGRRQRGSLSTFEPEVVRAALELKQKHRRWGPDRVLIKLAAEPKLTGKALPSRSRLTLFYQQQCPECVGAWQRARPTAKPCPPPRATAVHEVWQVDAQEGIKLADGEVATVCNIRDPYGAAMIASLAFSVKTTKHWRKLSWQEVRQVLRSGFRQWQTLPDNVLTDNELCLGGHPTDPLPSSLSLWLVGLGVKHDFIRPHTPTDQPQVERHHRTLDGFTFDEDSRADVDTFQQALDHERDSYNHFFPSRASDCNRHPPLLAHPQLLQPRRPYQPEWEQALFDMQRVYHYLATFSLPRKVNSSGQVSLKGRLYSIGRQHANKEILVCFDPRRQQWLFRQTLETGQRQLLARRPLKDLDFQALTGLTPASLALELPVQLTLPLPL